MSPLRRVYDGAAARRLRRPALQTPDPHPHAPNRRLALAALAALALLLSACGEKNLPLDSLDPEGPIARDIDNLFTWVFGIAAVVFVLVEGFLVFAVLRHRRRKGEEDRAVKQSHGNTRLEITWTVLPALLLAGIAVPTVATQFDIRSEPEGERIEITVTGHQWWWEFEFPQYGFTTANEIHIPAGKDVYLTMTSADVIHSFWLPNLSGKRDLVPGRTSNLTLIADDPTPAGKPFFGVCAEFCGLAHADMRMLVFVDTEEDFEAWAAAQAEPAIIPTEGLAAEGYDTFGQVCSACHAVAGTEYDQRRAPDLTHFGGRTTFGGASIANDTAHLEEWLADPSDLKPMDPDRNDLESGRILGMPNFGLDEAQIDGLVALLQSWK